MPTHDLANSPISFVDFSLLQSVLSLPSTVYVSLLLRRFRAKITNALPASTSSRYSQTSINFPTLSNAPYTRKLLVFQYICVVLNFFLLITSPRFKFGCSRCQDGEGMTDILPHKSRSLFSPRTVPLA